MSTVADEIKVVEKKLGWLLDPTHIILMLALAGALFAGVYLFQGRRIAEANGRTAVAAAVAKQAKEDAAASDVANKALQAQKDQIITTLQAANVSLNEANTKLSDAMKAELQALLNQQKTDKVLPPTQQATRWTLLVPSHPVVTPTTTGFTVDAAGGLDTLLQLEQVPVLTAQLVQANEMLDNANKTIANDAVILQSEKDKHTSDVSNDGKQLDASQKETKKVQADFDGYKKKSHRNILRAYVAGVFTGVVLRKLLGF